MTQFADRQREFLATVTSPSGAVLALGALIGAAGLLVDANSVAAAGVLVLAFGALYRLARNEGRSQLVQERERRRVLAIEEAVEQLGLRTDATNETLSSVDSSLVSLAQGLERVETEVGALAHVDRQLRSDHEAQREALTLVRRRVARERSQRIVGVTHGLVRGSQPRQVTLVVSIHRSASTHLLDLLRALPGHGMWPTAEIWTALRLRGRRYPADLSDGPGGVVELEVTEGRGELIPAVDAERWAIPTIAVEKLHPEFYGYDEPGFADLVASLDRRVPVRVLYLVRRPLDSMWSMAEYKARRNEWYPDLDIDDIPRVISESLASIERLRALVPGPVLTYDDVTGPSATMLALLSPDDPSGGVEPHIAPAPDSSVFEDSADRDRTTQGFIGERDRDRSADGPEGRWSMKASTIDDAGKSWRRLVGQNSES